MIAEGHPCSDEALVSVSAALLPYRAAFTGAGAAAHFAAHHVVSADKSMSVRVLSRAEFWTLAKQCATVLSRDGRVGRGDHVVHYFGRNSILDLAFRLAATMLGAVPVTVNWDADTVERIAYKIGVTAAKVVLYGDTVVAQRRSDVREAVLTAAGACASPIEIDAVDALVAAAAPLDEASFCAAVPTSSTRIVIFTSGTTGRPKGVNLTYNNYATNAGTFDSFLLGATRCDGDHSVDALAVFVTNPLHHTNSTAITDWAMRRPRSRLSLLSKYTTRYWNILTALVEETTAAAATPTTVVCPLVARHLDFLEAVVDGNRLADGLTPAALRAALSAAIILLGSAPVGPTTIARMQRFAGKLPTVRFGSTETCLQVLGTPCHLSEEQRLAAFQKGWANEWPAGASQKGYFIGRPHHPFNDAKIVKSKEMGDPDFMVECAEGEPGDLVVRGGNVMGNGYVESAVAGNIGITRKVIVGEERWYTNLGDRAFFRINDADGEKDIYWQSRDSALLIKGGSNYAYEQINAELREYLLAHPTLSLNEEDFTLAVVGLKIDSEHEDTCIATIELHHAVEEEAGEEAKAAHAARRETISDALITGIKTYRRDHAEMSAVEVSKASKPDHVVFATVHKNFKGAILTKALKKQAEELLAKRL